MLNFLVRKDNWASFLITRDSLFKNFQEPKEIMLTSRDLDNWSQFMLKHYGTTKYSTLLALYNKNLPIDLNPGDIYYLPVESDLENIYGSVS